MKTYKIIERTCCSSEGLKKAVSEGVKEVCKLDGPVSEVSIQDISALVENGEVVDWQIKMKFLISE